MLTTEGGHVPIQAWALAVFHRSLPERGLEWQPEEYPSKAVRKAEAVPDRIAQGWQETCGKGRRWKHHGRGHELSCLRTCRRWIELKSFWRLIMKCWSPAISCGGRMIAGLHGNWCIERFSSMDNRRCFLITGSEYLFFADAGIARVLRSKLSRERL